jgi:hypothetical protein
LPDCRLQTPSNQLDRRIGLKRGGQHRCALDRAGPTLWFI